MHGFKSYIIFYFYYYFQRNDSSSQPSNTINDDLSSQATTTADVHSGAGGDAPAVRPDRLALPPKQLQGIIRNKSSPTSPTSPTGTNGQIDLTDKTSPTGATGPANKTGGVSISSGLVTKIMDEPDAEMTAKPGKYQTMLEDQLEEEEEEDDEEGVETEKRDKDKNWEMVDLDYSPEESDDFVSVRL